MLDEGLMRALLLLLLAAMPASAVPLPLVCEVTSEEIPSIKVLLTERTAVSLKGELLQGSKTLGTFQTGQSNGYGSVWWFFYDQHDKGDGTSVLFNVDQHLNPHRSIPRPSETNRVLCVGFASDLWYLKNLKAPGDLRGNRDLLKAAAGFWTISDQCLGDRIVRG